MPPSANTGGATLLSRIRSLRRSQTRLQRDVTQFIQSSERVNDAQVICVVDARLRALGFRINHHGAELLGRVEGGVAVSVAPAVGDESEEDDADSDGSTDADAEGETDEEDAAEGEDEAEDEGEEKGEEKRENQGSGEAEVSRAEDLKQAVSVKPLTSPSEEKENQHVSPSRGSGKFAKQTIGTRGQALGDIQNTTVGNTVPQVEVVGIHYNPSPLQVPRQNGLTPVRQMVVPTSQYFQPRVLPKAPAFRYNENALVHPQYFSVPTSQNPAPVSGQTHNGLGVPLHHRQQLQQRAVYPGPMPQVMQHQPQQAQPQIMYPNQMPQVKVNRFQSYAEELANYHHAQLVRRLVPVPAAPTFPMWNPNFQQFYGGGFVGQPMLAPHQVMVPVYDHRVGVGYGGYAGNGPQIAAPHPVRPMQQLPMLNVSTPGHTLAPVEGIRAVSKGPVHEADPPAIQTSDETGNEGRSDNENREGLKRAEPDRESEDEDRGAMKKRKIS
ncbi:hypothetical protein EST38_g2403 [Candolleomyces aberdarensis]|uniref:Uncharacterized protein n=1 Tax=Candolleomyces aberdarensis TaxID=2316362 RepID=A0A4V1Q4V8_9AGAR|nr:hypothetical protein EST38_g2403 [Candolleomyces aberdarensis]